MNRSLTHFIGEALSSIFQLADTKIGRSFWTLLRKPGELTNAYMAGNRVPYLHPFRVFLVANVIFFLIVSLTGSSPLTTRLATHLAAENFFHQPLAKRLVDDKLGKEDIDYQQYEAGFNRRIDTLSKSLVLIMIPIFAGILGVVFVRRRDFAVRHLAFACHAYAFLLFYNFLMATGLLAWIIATVLTSDGTSLNTYESVISGFSLLTQSIFLYVALRRAYRTSRATSILLAIGLGFVTYIILLVYRAALFFAAFYSL